MVDVQTILLSCKVLELYCHVAGDGSDVGHDRREANGKGIVAEFESRFNQLHAQTSKVLRCWTLQRYPDTQIVRRPRMV